MVKPIPKSTDLKETFQYREDGNLIRKTLKGGRLAGTNNGKGYFSVKFKGFFYLLHKLIYCYHNDDWPDVLDHIDRDKSNNKIENLRPANKSLNEGNTGRRENNTSGYKGVSFHLKANKWRAYLQCKHIGLFETAEEAAEAYNEQAIIAYGEFAYLNKTKVLE